MLFPDYALNCQPLGVYINKPVSGASRTKVGNNSIVN